MGMRTHAKRPCEKRKHQEETELREYRREVQESATEVVWPRKEARPTSILYIAPSFSRIMRRRHCGCRGFLVGKRVQEVWEKKRKKGKKEKKKS